MKKILIDTNFYTAFKLNQPDSIEAIRKSEKVYMNPVILAELYSGFKLGSREEKNLKELGLFLESPRVEVLSITENTSIFYAGIFSNLKNKGKPIPVNDIWIAASAMEHGLMLASFDSHFNEIDGLMFRRISRRKAD